MALCLKDCCGHRSQTTWRKKASNAGTAEAEVAMGTYHGDGGWGRGRRGQGRGSRASALAATARLGSLHRKRISSLKERAHTKAEGWLGKNQPLLLLTNRKNIHIAFTEQIKYIITLKQCCTIGYIKHNPSILMVILRLNRLGFCESPLISYFLWTEASDTDLTKGVKGTVHWEKCYHYPKCS